MPCPWRERLADLATRTRRNDHAFLVANYNRIGQIYQTRGDLAQAESNFGRACAICQKQLGPNHPYTNQAELGLAQTYAAALNESLPLYHAAPSVIHAATARLEPARTPNPTNPESSPAKQSGSALASAIVSKRTGEVRRAVVPVLVRGLDQATSVPDRLGYIQALARLGPAAQDAVPTLVKVRRATRDPAERQAIDVALTQMGPTVDQSPPVGIKDGCSLFTVQAINETQKALLALARSRGLPVYIETVDGQTDRDSKDREIWAKASAGSICLLIHKDPIRVQIRVPGGLRRDHFNQACQDKLQTLIEHSFKAHKNDQALLRATRFLCESAGK